MRTLEDAKKYRDNTSQCCVLIEDGIMPEETLQNRQNASILMNIVYNENVWCTWDDGVDEQLLDIYKNAVNKMIRLAKDEVEIENR